MNDIYKKLNSKCVPLVITPQVREHIRLFKESLQCIKDDPTISSEFDARTIDIILNELDDYDRNLLIAYYSIAESSVAKLSRLIGISQPVIHRKLKVIHKKIIDLNDTPKTVNNKPRGDIDN